MVKLKILMMPDKIHAVKKCFTRNTFQYTCTINRLHNNFGTINRVHNNFGTAPTERHTSRFASYLFNTVPPCDACVFLAVRMYKCMCRVSLCFTLCFFFQGTCFFTQHFTASSHMPLILATHPHISLTGKFVFLVHLMISLPH